MKKINWNYPTIMWVGENRINDLTLACEKLKITRPLLVTDKNLSKSKIILDSFQKLKKNNIYLEIFSEVVGNPTGKNVFEGVDFFIKIIVMV